MTARNKRGIFYIALLIILILIGCCSCKTKVVVTEKVRIDTTYVSQTRWDSIYLHDSTYIREKGETIWIEKTRYKYIERLTHDTIYRHRVDSIPQPYPVEAKLTLRQRFAIRFFPWLLVFALLAGVYIVRKPLFSIIRRLI